MVRWWVRSLLGLRCGEPLYQGLVEFDTEGYRCSRRGPHLVHVNPNGSRWDVRRRPL